ncbi:MAG: aminotransferase class I/II-fold pyridoxal phosphate-dependent enzyme [Bacteroidetes bacterium]|nr:aminotransferase class I/II-fold pyridoxal phosphate-dependent enzyme [Bacteroidota bacterium]
MAFESKLQRVGTTIFSTMSALAVEHQAVNLGQGFPDFPMPEALREGVSKAMRDGFNQYAPMPGYLPLREKIAEKVQALYGASIDPSTAITITPGGTYAIYTALTTIVHPGDEVIVFEPAYDSYIPNIELNRGVVVTISLSHPDYRIDWEELKRKITPRTRAIVLNSPHNPTGQVLTDLDIVALRSIVSEHPDLYLISDEVYENLIFDGMPHLSMLRYPDLRERSFVCFSFGKVYHCTGWKLGYCIAPEGLMKEFRKVHQFNVFTCFAPAQVALAEYLENKEGYLLLGTFLQRKRDLFLSLMQGSRFEFLPSHGSYFICAKYHKISEESDTDFAIRLIKEAGVATIPVSAFYRTGEDHKVLRFCFAKKEETLRAARERLSGVR